MESIVKRMNTNNKIGFIGAGIMGQGMVQNLLKAGNEVSIIANKNRRPIDELIALGANEVLSLADMASCCNSFILCLPSSATAISVCDELFPLLFPETLIKKKFFLLITILVLKIFFLIIKTIK